MKWARVALVSALILLMAGLVARRYDPVYGLTTLIQFDEFNQHKLIPELEAVPKYIRKTGYDGQLYAQVAMDPSLRNPFFRKADSDVQYRARRIFLPAVAYVCGGGRPVAIVRVYAVLNLAFWILFLWVLVRENRLVWGRDLLVAAALALTTGALESVRLALTDLPAVTLLFLAYQAIRQQWLWGAVVFASLSILTRETMVLALPGMWVGFNAGWRPTRRGGIALLGVIIPVIVWNCYVRGMLYARVDYGTTANFSLPFMAMGERGLVAWRYLERRWNEQEIFTLLALAGLLVQAVYFGVRRRWSDPLWLMGAAFACFLPWLGSAVWEAHMAVCRSLLPMTVAFNWLLARHEGRAFRWWFIAGNLFGMYGVWKFIVYRL